MRLVEDLKSRYNRLPAIFRAMLLLLFSVILLQVTLGVPEPLSPSLNVSSLVTTHLEVPRIRTSEFTWMASRICRDLYYANQTEKTVFDITCKWINDTCICEKPV